MLIVQQGDHRRFSEDEEAFSYRIGPAGGVDCPCRARRRDYQTSPITENTGTGARLSGIAACSGIGIGQAAWITPHADLQSVPSRESTDRRAELKAFREALANVRADIQQVAENREELGPKIARCSAYI